MKTQLYNETTQNEIKDALSFVDKNSAVLDNIIDEIVLKYSKELDDLMVQIKEVLSDFEKEISDSELHSLTLRIPNILYFILDAQESLGVREDVAQAIEKEIYNKAHLSAKGTVSIKKSFAEAESQKEAITSIVLSRAYKKIKLRVDAGYKMLDSVKKVISARIASMDIAKSEPN